MKKSQYIDPGVATVPRTNYYLDEDSIDHFFISLDKEISKCETRLKEIVQILERLKDLRDREYMKIHK